MGLCLVTGKHQENIFQEKLQVEELMVLLTMPQKVGCQAFVNHFLLIDPCGSLAVHLLNGLMAGPTFLQFK